MENQVPQEESMFYNPEPWEPWETKLVAGSIIIAVISLIILAVLINMLILS
jgi:hypothetical protein